MAHSRQPRRGWAAPIAVVALAFFLLAGCAAMSPATTRVTRPLVFPTSELEEVLRRGVSSRADVEELLGQPNGTGSLMFPEQHRAREIWFYERVEVKSVRNALVMQQDVLLVFFRHDVYDGFMWFSDAAGASRSAGGRP